MSDDTLSDSLPPRKKLKTANDHNLQTPTSSTSTVATENNQSEKVENVDTQCGKRTNSKFTGHFL